MIKKPLSKLPFHVTPLCDIHDDENNAVCHDMYLQDAQYMIEASNSYSELIDLLERIEGETFDKKIADKIRNYLVSKQIWEPVKTPIIEK